MTFSPDANSIYYGSGHTLYQLPVLGGTPKRVLEHFGGQNNAATFSPDGKQFAFVRFSEGNESSYIIVANADGTDERILASSQRPAIFRSPAAWSPDGKVIACPALTAAGPQAVVTVQLADGAVSSIPSPRWDSIKQVAWRPDGGSLFVIAAETERDFFAQIWQLSYPSGAARNITNDSNNYESISLTADGSRLVAVRLEQVAHVWVMPGEQTEQAKQLTSGFEKYDGTHALEWLINDKIVYGTAPSGKGEVWTIDADGRNSKQVAIEAMSVAVSLNGNYFVFQSHDADGVGLFRLNVVNGEKKRLTRGTDIWATLTPDEKWIVFTRWGDQVGLWKAPLEGGEAAKLTNIPGYLLAPAVSPNGKLIAFFWGKTGRNFPKIGVVPFEGGKIIRTFDDPAQYFPGYSKATVQWTADGRAINYIALRDGVSNIWRQAMNGSPPVKVTDFKTGFIFNFSYSRDGKRLALSRGTFERDVILLRDME